MRRLYINLAVTVLTFAIGIAASALLGLFTPSVKNAGGPSVATTVAPPKPANAPTTAACRCSKESSGNPVETSPYTAPIISGGILNGKAVSLPQPVYPPVAKAARQFGTVVVQITIDERGCVMAARAVSGPPLLQAAAVQAAEQACFSPTRLSGQPVKVTGVVTYNFVLP